MPRRVDWAILLVAVALRALLLGWDSGLLSPHPDERQVAFVASEVEGWLDDPGFYAYGSLHFQAVRAAAVVRGLATDYQGILLGGRALSLVASVVSLALGWLLARWAWGRRTSTLVLAVAAVVPLDLQLAHFATVEAHHAAWVMAALAGSCWLAWRGRTVAALAAGAAWGASLAVKVASLPVALAVLAALLLLAARRGGVHAWRQGAVAAGAAALAFWLGQPSAFVGRWPPLALVAALVAVSVCLGGAAAAAPGVHRRLWLAAAGGLSASAAVLTAACLGLLQGPPALVAPLAPAFLQGVGEQVAMVRGGADLPYTRVYAGTLPVLYPLRELALWGWGPALLLVAVAGAGRALLRLPRRLLRGPASRSSTLLAVLLAFTVPTALGLATVQVKYLRYWAPLTVPGVLLAVWAASRLRRPWRRRATAVLVAGTALWGLAYLWAFAEPHPHRVAAEWLRPLLEPGHTVAFEHWDETLPVAVPGVRTVQLPSYELPDDEAKLRRWCGELAAADWVVLTSHRVRRTVLANPGRFPHTGRLYEALLRGEAGFEPLLRVDRAPRLLGLVPPVQRADESFVNYDFPRVVVLRRVAEVDVRALVDRALSGPSPPPFSQLEGGVVSRLPELAPVPSAGRQLWLVVAWVVLLTATGAAVWTLLGPLLRHWPDGGWGLALASGWVLPGWLMWLGCRVGLWPAGPETASWVLAAVLGTGAAVGWWRRERLLVAWRVHGRHVLVVAAVALAVGALFLAVRASNPAIHWGEKPMDSTFLHAFLRADSWPPGEPWMAGRPLHYYYLGEVLAALPILATDAGGAVGYNLMAATLPALAAALLAAVGLRLRRRRLAAGLLPLLVLLSGNLAWPFLLQLARQGRLFDLWWATSRVIPGFAIDEYPLWTALFADLHAHFLALPVLLLAAAWGWVAVERTGRAGWLAATACGVTAGVLAGTNPWDVLVLTATLAVVAVLSARPAAALARLAAAAVVSGLAALPFLVELASWADAGMGGTGVALNRGGFAPWWALPGHLGLFVLPLLALAVRAAGRRLVLVVPLAAAAAAVGWSMGSGAAALALGLAVLYASAGVAERGSLARRTAWGLAVVAMLLVAGCERITLIDRMNTLFKVYNGLWPVLAVALGVHLLRRRASARRLLLAVWAPLQVVALVNLPLGVAQGWLEPRMPSPRPTLDGQAFLRQADPQTWFLVRTLQGVAGPGDVVAEAAGDPYREYARISMHTGLATVLGWPWHLQQRGQPPAAIQVRAAALESLYGGSDPEIRRRMLESFSVDWVVLAEVERRRYELAREPDLDRVPGVQLLGSEAGAHLYLVRPEGQR